MTYQSPISPGRSWYEDTAGERPSYPALDGDRSADVVIVGGGFTGLSAAAHLAKAGTNVALIEARLPIFAGLVEGYVSAARPFLNAAEIAHLAFSGRLITLEIGMRFLTDFLAGDTFGQQLGADSELDPRPFDFEHCSGIDDQARIGASANTAPR